MLTGAQLIALTRKYTSDDTLPYDVDDDILYSFLTEAQREIAVVGRLLRKVLLFPVVANARFIDFMSATDLSGTPLGFVEILEFRKATLIEGAKNRYSLRLQGTLSPTSQNNMRWDYGLISRTDDILVPGRPDTLVFGKSLEQFELSPPSNAAYSIEADVITHPLYPIEADDDEPEIPEKYQIHLPLGAALRAMQVSDFYNINTQKQQNIETAWTRALAKIAAETGAISRDAGPVHFSNDMWIL